MATLTGFRRSKTFVGLLITHRKLQTFRIHIIDSLYVKKTNQVFIISHDTDFKSMPKSGQTNHISQYSALSSNVKSSINKNENYFAIWKIPDVIRDDTQTMTN